ncbi:MAG TPA: PilZ domain-containing protein [Terriglobales bacterium]|jgi:hypothetical protein|nr:PilZ domain-containing protein [Terriglobales bacterium]
MSTRNMRRTKVVLPVTVIRSDGERNLAHTLDVTMSSAKLGGLYTALSPGEIVEIQRGASRAKFQIVWVGAANSVMVGQAGAQGLFNGKNVWGVELPADQPDISVDAKRLRNPYPLVTTVLNGHQRRWQCRGSASVLADGVKFPVYAEIKDISLGGVYLESRAVFPVNTRVQLKLTVAGIMLDLTGTVRTSDAKAGMGIGFHKGSRENEERLTLAIGSLERESSQTRSAKEVISVGGSLEIVGSRAV